MRANRDPPENLIRAGEIARGGIMAGNGSAQDGFSDAERAAMKERAAELRAQRGGAKKADQAQAVQDKIAEMPDEERALAERVHAIVVMNAPQLDPKLWYGMPAYAKDGAVVCFFQAATKFDSRYCTVGFNDAAALDDGPMWPTTFALTAMTPETEARLVELVRRAVGTPAPSEEPGT
ncbi:iron chaperone [Microbacterium sp. NPDC078428]|uniref:iron chaperone n=1 Tax=Microbacterium sp. NPDC078428 TaxID=3364190 RepID=UPI0037C7EE28